MPACVRPWTIPAQRRPERALLGVQRCRQHRRLHQPGLRGAQSAHRAIALPDGSERDTPVPSGDQARTPPTALQRRPVRRAHCGAGPARPRGRHPQGRHAPACRRHPAGMAGLRQHRTRGRDPRDHAAVARRKRARERTPHRRRTGHARRVAARRLAVTQYTARSCAHAS